MYERTSDYPAGEAEAYFVRREATTCIVCGHKCGSPSAFCTEQAALRPFPLLRPTIAFHLREIRIN